MVLWLTGALVSAREGRTARRRARRTAALGCALALGAFLGAGCGSGGATTASSGGSGGNGGTGGSGGLGGGSAGEAGGGTSGADPSPSCGFSPCGGELDGVWTAREVCLVELEPRPEPGCENAFAHSATVEGSYTFFEQTGRLLTDVTLTPFVTLDVDDACASSLAGTRATADDACPQLQAQYDEDSAFVAAACGMQGEVCHCLLEAPSVSQNVLNEYRTEGTRIIDAQGDPVDYCVEGDVLGLEFVDPDFRLTLIFDRGS
jgi:hypothetical protein